MHTSPTNRIDAALSGRPPGLWPFVVAGYPSTAVAAELVRSIAKLPVRGIEIGFPFSDSIADGPVIQNAFTHALGGGVRVGDIFEAVRSLRGQIDLPILAMVSASIVYRSGVEAFVQRSVDAGFDGLIVPDLSLEEAPALSERARQAGMHLVMLIAPTTPEDRQGAIAAAAGGFLYYVSVQGTTGERDRLPADVAEHVARLRRSSGLPVLVGFGISTPRQVREVCAVADGAIVGSAIVKHLTEGIQSGLSAEALVRATTEFVGQFVAGGP